MSFLEKIKQFWHYRWSLALWRQNKHLRLELSSKCQLKCPLCLTGTHYHRRYSAVGWGHLSLDKLLKFLEQNPQIESLELSNYGELFLHPHIKEILAIAHQKNIALTALNGTNLNHLPDDVAEALVLYGFKKMKVSIDGASQESYQKYRVGGNFGRVIENIKKINFYKEKHKSTYPKLKWQFIVFGHNEKELPIAKKMAKELNMTFKAKLNYSPKKFPIQDAKFVASETELGVAYITDFEEKERKMYSPACLQLWTAPQINWDGKLLGCCVNHFGDFGNVFEEGLDKLLRSEKYIYAKKMLLGQVPNRKDIPCSQCSRYKKVLQMPFKDHLLEALGKLPK
ncbi:MAG: hypothetical protein OHK0045_22170 [Raineya sp.]